MIRQKKLFFKTDYFFFIVFFVLAFLFFRDVFTVSDSILIHGDYRYALTVNEQFLYHLDNLQTHAPKLPLLLLLFPLKGLFGDILAEKLFTVLIFALSSFMVYIANKYFISSLSKRDDGKWISFFSFIGTLAFIYNPWSIDKIHHHYWLVLSLAASYLLIAKIDTFIRIKRLSLSNILVIAFLMTMVATQPQSIVMYFGLMVVIYVLVNIFYYRTRLFSKKVYNRLFIGIIVIILCNVFWLLPEMQSLFAYNLDHITSNGRVEENVDQLSRRASISNVLSASGVWVWGGDANANPAIDVNGVNIWERIAFLPIAIGISFFVFLRKSIDLRIIVFIGALLVASIILSTGSYYITAYKWMYLKFPLGEILRDPYKFTGLYVVSLTFFIGALLFQLKQYYHKKYQFLAVPVIVTIILLWGWPALTGNLNGHITSSILPYPDDLMQAINYLHEHHDNDTGRIFWYPDSSDLLYQSLPELSTSTLSNLVLSNYELSYLKNLIADKDSSALDFLEELNVHYMILRSDIKLTSQSDVLSKQIANLKEMLEPNKVYSSGYYTIYELNPRGSLTLHQNIAMGSDDLSKVIKINSANNYSSPQEQYGPFLNEAIVFSQPPNISDKDVIIIHPTSEHYNPATFWSEGSIRGGYLNTIGPYLEKYQIANWQFDYDHGTIFTWNSKGISDNLNSNGELVKQIDFNSMNETSEWQINRKDAQQIQWNEGVMKVILSDSSEGWKTITSPHIDVDSSKIYSFSLRMAYEKEYGIHIKLIEFDKNSHPLATTRMNTLADGSSGWKEVKFQYTPSQETVQQIQISIWHGHTTSKRPSPSTISLDYLQMFDVSNNFHPTILKMPFNVDENGSYRMFIRFLESSQGGSFRINLNNQYSKVNESVAQNSNFIWKDLGTFDLNNGTNEITFENEKGFNAINSVLLIRSEKYNAMENKIDNWLSNNNTRIFYIFDGKSDFNKTEPNDETVANASEMNGVSRDIGIIKDDNYHFVVRGMGQFLVEIGGYDKTLTLDKNQESSNFSVHLHKGNYRLSFSPVADRNATSTLDSVWLYSNNKNSDIKDSRSNSSFHYDKINSDTYLVHVNATAPFLITLSDSFNPEFKAEVYKNGELVGSAKSMPILYSLANGFWIDTVGDNIELTITTKTRIQDAFEIGAIFSFLSYFILIVLLIASLLIQKRSHSNFVAHSSIWKAGKA